jgi:hypothetical protein
MKVMVVPMNLAALIFANAAATVSRDASVTGRLD